MVDNPTRINIGQRLNRPGSPCFFLIDPGHQGLFHDPAPRPLKPRRKLIHLFRKGPRNVSGKDLGVQGVPRDWKSIIMIKNVR